MRRALPLLAVLASIGLAACGSSSSSSSPVNSELSYFPSATPFVMSVVTDPNSSAVKQAQALLRRFPLATFGESVLISRLQQQGINYNSDIRPLFGNPLMFGVSAPSGTGSARNRFLVAWVTKDAGALGTLVKKLSPRVQRTGTYDGASIYQGASSALAVDGATLLIANSVLDVRNALDRRAHSAGISASEFNRATAGLPGSALVQTFGSLTGLLSRPHAAKARRVPWVAALRAYAASISASSTGLNFQYRLDTSGEPLTGAQVPIASGATAPNLAGSMPILVGLRDPSQFASFLESAQAAAAPAPYSGFLRRQADLRRKTGADVNTLVGLLKGDLMVESDTHRTLARVGVSDPASAQRTLAKLARQPRDLSTKATGVTRAPGGFYLLHEPRQTIAVGVVGDQLVAGRATPAELRAFAAAPTAPAADAQGAFAFRFALTDLLRLAFKRAPSKLAQTILSSLGELSGWTASSATALTGSATLGFR